MSKYSYEQKVNSLPKVKYSSLSELEKRHMLKNAIYDLTYDMVHGHLEFQKNDEWYRLLLRLIQDYGYDITPIKDVDWDNLQNVCDFCYPVVIKIENMPFPEGYSVFDIRQLFAQQIIIDD
ncbi:MAG: hypothetical protein II922_11330 [Succinimonas sp.]|nr:hypothetical protein [Succinimonas sp.]